MQKAKRVDTFDIGIGLGIWSDVCWSCSPVCPLWKLLGRRRKRNESSSYGF